AAGWGATQGPGRLLLSSEHGAPCRASSQALRQRLLDRGILSHPRVLGRTATAQSVGDDIEGRDDEQTQGGRQDQPTDDRVGHRTSRLGAGAEAQGPGGTPPTSVATAVIRTGGNRTAPASSIAAVALRPPRARTSFA